MRLRVQAEIKAKANFSELVGKTFLAFAMDDGRSPFAIEIWIGVSLGYMMSKKGLGEYPDNEARYSWYGKDAAAFLTEIQRKQAEIEQDDEGDIEPYLTNYSFKDEEGWDAVLEANPPKKCKIEYLNLLDLLGINTSFGG